ncbi:MAG: PPC domain-containing protein [Gemmataceae bacterium]|nr:PPC domain-containing protein [Gemmataceae bacterium]
MRRSHFILPLLLVSQATAAPPTVTNVTPRGAERGRPVELALTGTNLTSTARLVLPFAAEQEPIPDKKPTPTQARVRLTVDRAVPAGIYPVRVLTDEGVSPLFFFHVDSFPAATEVEDNNTFAKAQKVAVPAVIDGQCAGGDVDYFRFAAKKGQRLVIETIAARLGSGVQPQIRVTDARERLISSDDTQALQGDCRVWFVAPQDGEYVVEISDSRYRGAAPPHYRLKIADYDFPAEVFPLGGRAGEKVEFVLRGGNLSGEVRLSRVLPPPSAGPPGWRWIPLDLGESLRPGMLAPLVIRGELPERTYPESAKEGKPLELAAPVTANGRLTRKGEVHRFRLPVKGGERYRLAVQADVLGSALDGVLRVTDPAGKQLAISDDVDVPPPAPGLQATKSPDPALEVTTPAGVTALVVELRDGRHRGGVNFGYRFTVTRAEDFALRQTAAEVNVPRGGSAALVVPVVRRGYDGPIQLGIPELPPGWSVQGGYVPPKGTQGVLTLSAPANGEALIDPLTLGVQGRALAPGKDLRRWAEQTVVVTRDANVAVLTMPLSGFAVALIGPDVFTLKGPAAVEVVNGYPTSVAVEVTRDQKEKVGTVAVTGAGSPPTPGKPPTGLTFKPGSAAPNAGQATLLVTAPVTLPEGRTTDLVIQGKTRVNNVDRTVTAPAIPVTVVRPFTVTLSEVTLEPGKTAVVRGTIQRQPVCKEAVQLKLDGLPKVVTLAAPPKAVPAGQSEFTLELRADAKAAPTAVNLTLTASAVIGGATYTHPAVSVPLKVGP